MKIGQLTKSERKGRGKSLMQHARGNQQTTQVDEVIRPMLHPMFLFSLEVLFFVFDFKQDDSFVSLACLTWIQLKLITVQRIKFQKALFKFPTSI
jgi:hypothetical protein